MATEKTFEILKKEADFYFLGSERRRRKRRKRHFLEGASTGWAGSSSAFPFSVLSFCPCWTTWPPPRPVMKLLPARWKTEIHHAANPRRRARRRRAHAPSMHHLLRSDGPDDAGLAAAAWRRVPFLEDAPGVGLRLCRRWTSAGCSLRLARLASLWLDEDNCPGEQGQGQERRRKSHGLSQTNLAGFHGRQQQNKHGRQSRPAEV